MDINKFVQDNQTILIIIAVIIGMTIVGYIAEKTEFGKKVIEKKNKTKEKLIKAEDKSDSIETNLQKLANVRLDGTIVDDNNVEDKKEPITALDEIGTNFNDGGLMIGDVNENPNITNAELGISEDLYAPFGDGESEIKNVETKIDDLKIEEVVEDDFNIIEKDKKDEYDENQAINLDNLNVAIEDIETSPESLDNLIIEDAEPFVETETNPIVDEINDLVDNTFVINEASTDIFNSTPVIENENQSNSEETLSLDNENNDEVSKIQQFTIDESELETDIQTDFNIETTTSLKLDEINEQIKNLKLEDSENILVEEEKSDKKRRKKNKKMTIKSVDDIKNSNEEKNKELIDLETEEKNIKETDLNNEVMNEEKDLHYNSLDEDLDSYYNEEADVVSSEMELPNLDDVASNDDNVSEQDDIWKF